LNLLEHHLKGRSVIARFGVVRRRFASLPLFYFKRRIPMPNPIDRAGKNACKAGRKLKYCEL
jgi:hypothetical protein